MPEGPHQSTIIRTRLHLVTEHHPELQGVQVQASLICHQDVCAYGLAPGAANSGGLFRQDEEPEGILGQHGSDL
eukprot:6304650-Pyramimonas_sp.AAC.1